MEKRINKRAEQYWLSKFANEFEPFSLPWQSGREQKDYAYTLTLSEETTTEILNICNNAEPAIITYLAAALSFALSAYTGTTELIINIPSGRQPLPLKMGVNMDETYRDHLGACKKAVMEGFSNAEFSFTGFKEKLKARNSGFPEEAFSRILLAPASYADLGGKNTDRFDFSLLFSVQDGRFVLNFEYSASEQLMPVAEQMAETLGIVVSNGRANLQRRLNDIELLTDSHLNLLTEVFNKGFAPAAPATYTVLFAETVSKYGDRTALIHNGKKLSYTQLDQEASRMANALIDSGVKKGDVVPLIADRSLEMIIALVGVLKAGAAFLPIDPAYPEERVQYMLTDSKATVALMPEKYLGHCMSGVKGISFESTAAYATSVALPVTITPEDLAYIIYTSGTTGVPNGVMIEHRSLVSLCAWHNTYYNLTPEDVSTKYAGFGFDATVWEIFPVLLSGAALYVVEDDARQDIALLSDRFNQYGVTTSFLPTQFGEQFMYNAPAGLKNLLLGGDKLRRTNEEAPFKVYNNYGPTENTVVSTAGLVNTNEDNIPIGRPIATTKAFILSPGGTRLQPMGVAGELCLSGPALARGYWGKEELTAKKFVENPVLKGERMYRTGDLAKWLPDGTIAFLGRADNQVKLRGYRIEVGEIEKNLTAFEGIEDAVVVKNPGLEMLYAYYVSAEPFTEEELSKFLARRVPSFMVPSAFVRLPEIPMTANGKADRKRLEQRNENVETIAYVAAENEVEKALQQVWQEVLGREKIGTADNFFVLGGDSIKAIQIQSRLMNRGFSLKTKNIFEYPTIQQLTPTVLTAGVIAEQGAVHGDVPLSPVQAEFFRNDGMINKGHFNQAVMLSFDEKVEADLVYKMCMHLQEHHDALRMTFRYNEAEGRIVQHNHEKPVGMDIQVVSLETQDAITHNAIIERTCNNAQSEFDIASGSLLKAVLFQYKNTSQLAVIIHHLVVDGVSWRILLEDLDTLFRQAKMGEGFKLPAKTDSFKTYAEQLSAYTNSSSFSRDKNYWESLNAIGEEKLFPVNNVVPNLVGQAQQIDINFDKAATDLLLYRANSAYNTEVNHLLLTALYKAIQQVTLTQQVTIWMEGHGRQEIMADLDISRTVGWFTNIYPLQLKGKHDNLRDLIISVKDSYNRVPEKGIGYGMLQYLHEEAKASAKPSKEITFNYLGQFGSDISERSFGVSSDLLGELISGENTNQSELEVFGMIAKDTLSISFKYVPGRLATEDMQALADAFKSALADILNHCREVKEPVATATDFTCAAVLPQETVDQLVERYAIADIYTLSPGQEGILLPSLADKNSANYFEQMGYNMAYSFEAEGLEKAYHFILNRHEVFRTAYYYGKGTSRAVQVVRSKVENGFSYIDLSNLSTGEVKARIEAYKAEDKKRGFDLKTDTLLRLVVFKTGEKSWTFVWSYHHIVMDGWCLGIVFKEYYHAYQHFAAGAALQLPAAKPFGNYVSWVEGRDKESFKSYWQQYFQGFDNKTFIRTVNEKGSGYTATHKELLLDESLTNGLTKLATASQVTLSTVLQSIWGVVLSRYTNSQDVLFGKVVSGRPSEVDGVESMVGMFINTVPCRIRIKGFTTFSDMLKGLQHEAIKQEQYHYQSLSEVQKYSNLGSEIFDHIFAFENYPLDEMPGYFEEYALSGMDVFEQTNYDFNVVVVPGSQLKVNFKYNADTFPEWYVEGIKEAYAAVVQQVILNTDIVLKDLAITGEQGRSLLLKEFNHTVPQATEKTYHSLFADQVSATPHNTALLFKDRKLTYRQTEEHSNYIARQLSTNGAGKGKVVAVMLDKSLEMVTSLLGTLKTGAAFLPIDPEYPKERIRHILTDSGADILITSENYAPADEARLKMLFAEELGQGTLGTFVAPEEVGPEDMAYIIYTSGTTGVPNGAIIPHKGLVSLCQWHNEYYEISETDVSSKFAGFGFDATIWEIFPPLLSGSALYIIEEALRYDIKRLHESFSAYGVTVSFLPTQFAEQFMALPAPAKLKKLLVGGDKLKKVSDTLSYEVYNNYGPTENTVVATACRVLSNDKNIPIGKPVRSTQAYVLCPESLQLQPVGVPGELCLSGNALALGYVGKEDLTNRKFVQNPYGKGRMYRTGDLARYLPDGNLEFLGRIDNQVKVRGYRIELGEIESAMMNHGSITDATVVVKEMTGGNNILFGFYTAETELNQQELKTFLFENLPVYMVPAHLMYLKAMPVNQNGKTDRKALAAMAVIPKRITLGSQKMTPAQAKIRDLWLKVLDTPEIGLDDNFFDLGGTSMDIIKLSEELAELFPGENLSTLVFKYPTINSLTSFLEAGEKKEVVVKSEDEIKNIRDKRKEQRMKRRSRK